MNTCVKNHKDLLQNLHYPYCMPIKFVSKISLKMFIGHSGFTKFTPSKRALNLFFDYICVHYKFHSHVSPEFYNFRGKSTNDKKLLKSRLQIP